MSTKKIPVESINEVYIGMPIPEGEDDNYPFAIINYRRISSTKFEKEETFSETVNGTMRFCSKCQSWHSEGDDHNCGKSLPTITENQMIKEVHAMRDSEAYACIDFDLNED